MLSARSFREEEWSAFNGFITKFEKKYESFADFKYRFSVFQHNLQIISRHNSAQQENYTLGINAFTDLTAEEFRSQYIGSGLILTATATDSSSSSKSSCKPYTTTNSYAPDSLDWRSEGAVTPVKNQEQCGSCWAFSAVGAMEGAWAIKMQELVSLSEEQLVECSKKYGNLGCNGGLMDNAFAYVIDNGGICSELEYPYTSGAGQVGSCSHCNGNDLTAKFSGCMDVKPNDQLTLMAAVALGPVSIAIEADTRIFQSYKSGVITGTSCGTTLDHGVLIVGYGTETGAETDIPYWLVKNSWGETWGDDGYVKIERSSKTNDPGVCGVAMQPSFPVV